MMEWLANSCKPLDWQACLSGRCAMDQKENILEKAVSISTWLIKIGIREMSLHYFVYHMTDNIYLKSGNIWNILSLIYFCCSMSIYVLKLTNEMESKTVNRKTWSLRQWGSQICCENYKLLKVNQISKSKRLLRSYSAMTLGERLHSHCWCLPGHWALLSQ